jgi:hypothetical protein
MHTTSITNIHESVADLSLKADGIANENTNRTFGVALLVGTAEKDYNVIVRSIIGYLYCNT